MCDMVRSRRHHVVAKAVVWLSAAMLSAPRAPIWATAVPASKMAVVGRVRGQAAVALRRAQGNIAEAAATAGGSTWAPRANVRPPACAAAVKRPPGHRLQSRRARRRSNGSPRRGRFPLRRQSPFGRVSSRRVDTTTGKLPPLLWIAASSSLDSASDRPATGMPRADLMVAR